MSGGGAAIRDRALLWLAYVEGLSHEEIGQALALARGSVKVMLSRARARLRDVLRAGGWGGRGRGADCRRTAAGLGAAGVRGRVVLPAIPGLR